MPLPEQNAALAEVIKFLEVVDEGKRTPNWTFGAVDGGLKKRADAAFDDV